MSSSGTWRGSVRPCRLRRLTRARSPAALPSSPVASSARRTLALRSHRARIDSVERSASGSVVECCAETGTAVSGVELPHPRSITSSVERTAAATTTTTSKRCAPRVTGARRHVKLSERAGLPASSSTPAERCPPLSMSDPARETPPPPPAPAPPVDPLPPLCPRTETALPHRTDSSSAAHRAQRPRPRCAACRCSRERDDSTSEASEQR